MLFRQRRVGEQEKEFTILKFRTMVVGAHAQRDGLDNEADGLLFKMRRDPRVTKVGAFLRKTSLDELPQLFNVLSGEMSLVGPRPALPEEASRYAESQRGRLRVKPGVTGLWQVNGRHDLAFEDYVRYDLFYVENWSHHHGPLHPREDDPGAADGSRLVLIRRRSDGRRAHPQGCG